MSRRIDASELRSRVRDIAESQRKRARGQGFYAVATTRTDGVDDAARTPALALGGEGAVPGYGSFSEGSWRDYAFCVGAAAAAKEAAR